MPNDLIKVAIPCTSATTETRNAYGPELLLSPPSVVLRTIVPITGCRLR